MVAVTAVVAVAALPEVLMPAVPALRFAGSWGWSLRSRRDHTHSAWPVHAKETKETGERREVMPVSFSESLAGYGKDQGLQPLQSWDGVAGAKSAPRAFSA